MKYTIGVDYGTQSGRAVLVETATGCVRAQAVKEYTHGVMDEYLPDGVTRLGPDWALQHPMDYLEVLYETIPAVLKETGFHRRTLSALGSTLPPARCCRSGRTGFRSVLIPYLPKTLMHGSSFGNTMPRSMKRIN